MKILAFIVLYVVLTLSFPGQARGHDIDNLSTVLNAVPGVTLNSPTELSMRVDPTKNMHCDTAVCEGEKFNSCLTNPTVYKGRTMQQVSKNFWHWRRVLVAQFIILSGNVNAANEYSFMLKTPLGIPFNSYDPFFLGFDPLFPDVQQQYYTNYVPIGYKPLGDGGRANYGEFWLSMNVDLPAAPGLTGSTNPLHTEQCSTLSASEKMHAPECVTLAPDTFVLAGGDSYKTPINRGDIAFNYYDRLPQNPVGSACFEYLEGRMTIEQAIDYAMAHEVAGKVHVLAIASRIKYSELVLSWLRSRF